MYSSIRRVSTQTPVALRAASRRSLSTAPSSSSYRVPFTIEATPLVALVGAASCTAIGALGYHLLHDPDIRTHGKNDDPQDDQLKAALATKVDETVEKGKEKAGEAKDKVKEKAGDAKDKVKEKVDKGKDKVDEKVEKGKDKAGEVKDKAGEAKDKAKEKAGEAKDKAEDVKDKARDAASKK